MTNWSETRTPLTVGVRYPMSVWDDDYVYIFYGETDIGFSRTVLKYDIADDSYTLMTNLNYDVCGSACALDTVNNDAWILCGFNNTFNTVSTVKTYNLDTESITTKTSYPLSLTLLGSVYYDGKIYGFGGHNGSNSVANVYSWEVGVSSSWNAETNMPEAKKAFGYCPVGSKMYVVGGLPNLTYTCYVTDLDDETLSWTSLDDLPNGISKSAGSLFHYNDGSKDWLYFVNSGQGVYKMDVTNGATGNEWVDLNDDYPSRQFRAAIGQKDNELIIFGGQDSDDTYEENVLSYTIPIINTTIKGLLKRII